jgi:hypothetical protein
VAQHDTVAFNARHDAVAASGVPGSTFGHVYAKRGGFDVAVKSIVQIRATWSRCRAETTGEDISDDRQCNEHRQRRGCDADHRLFMTCHGEALRFHGHVISTRRTGQIDITKAGRSGQPNALQLSLPEKGVSRRLLPLVAVGVLGVLAEQTRPEPTLLLLGRLVRNAR